MSHNIYYSIYLAPVSTSKVIVNLCGMHIMDGYYKASTVCTSYHPIFWFSILSKPLDNIIYICYPHFLISLASYSNLTFITKTLLKPF